MSEHAGWVTRPGEDDARRGWSGSRLPELRIGDAERETAAGALGDHFAAGRIDRVELDQRLEAVWSARTASTLRALFSDLPAPAPFAARPGTASDPRAADRPNRAARRRFGGPSRRPWGAVAVALFVVMLVVTHGFVLVPLLWFGIGRHRWGRGAYR